MKKIQFLIPAVFITAFLSFSDLLSGQLLLNDQNYFHMPGLSVLPFTDNYPEGKQGGIEIIYHDQRIMTNGNVSLEVSPGQWAPLPEIVNKKYITEKNEVEISLAFSEPDLSCKIFVQSEEDCFRICMFVDGPVPEGLAGKSGLNIELFPGVVFGKSYVMDNHFGHFPRQAGGPVYFGPDSIIQSSPLARGKHLSIAPESPRHHIDIECAKGELLLYDGRNLAQNGWFIIRSELPANGIRNTIEWIIRPHVLHGYKREPVLLYSQAGYHPDQIKKLLIEKDPSDTDHQSVQLIRIDSTGSFQIMLEAVPEKLGGFLRYDYYLVDFTHVKEPGVYFFRTMQNRSSPFLISSDLYQTLWKPTMETYFPVQMCHVRVEDRYRVWHDVCHLDDALQAPLNHIHFDGYRQGSETNTPYDPYEHIPGLQTGGWHDAGDYDLAAGSQAATIYTLALAREAFHINSDQTTIQTDNKRVILHQPDGKNDVLQQIDHGLQNLLAGYRTVGHCLPGIISNSLRQYVHLGEANSMTNNQIDEGKESDDRWVFTSRSTALEYQAARALTAASRVLRGYDDSLAEECLQTAVRIWKYEQSHDPVVHRSAYISYNIRQEEILATIELYLTTQNEKYFEHLKNCLPDIQEQIGHTGWSVSRLLPFIDDPFFQETIRKSLTGYSAFQDSLLSTNPFHLPFKFRTWGMAWRLLRYGMRQFYLNRAFPDLFDAEMLYRVVHYVLGCHPGSNISFVSGVGAESVESAYGTNRADWAFIPGGVVSGTNLIRPDFPEYKKDFPFLWQQSEYVMSGAADYLFCIHAVDYLLNERSCFAE